MITREQFDRIEMEHGCGYWNVCWEHACPCAITTEHKGFKESIYKSLVEEANEVAKDTSYDDYDYRSEDTLEDDDYDSYEEDYEN